jgi:chromosome segregation ATPase
VDLTPLHNQLAEFQLQHNDLRTTVQEQTTTLKRVEDQLEMVREATDRNTLEQQELMEDLKAMGTRVSRIALGVSVLLLVSIGINLWLYLYIRRVLP